jgi:hypothetical protein
MAVQGNSVFEDRFAARPLFGGAIMCCIPANFHVGFHLPIILTNCYSSSSSSFCLCCFSPSFWCYGLLEFCLCLAQLSMDFVFHLVFSLSLVSNVQCSIFFPLCDCHETSVWTKLCKGCEDLVNQDQDLERQANFLNDCSISGGNFR